MRYKQPVVAAPAQPLDQSIPYSYSALAALLDLTTGCFPVTTVNENDQLPVDLEPLSDADKIVSSWCELACRVL